MCSLVEGGPFGESQKGSKKSLYGISDPALRFWYKVFSPHQSLWHEFSDNQRLLHLNEHASTVFEDFCRSLYPGSQRYWQNNVEIDMIRYAKTSDLQNKKSIVVSEIKWSTLKPREKEKLLIDLKIRWEKTDLSKKLTAVRFEVIDQTILQSL